MEENPGGSGVATGLVQALHEKTGIRELVLVGQGSSNLLLPDFAAVEDDPAVRVVFLGFYLPNDEEELAKLPVTKKATLMIGLICIGTRSP